MTDLLIGLCLIAGAAAMALAALGILRLPSLLSRLHAASLAGSAGAVLLLCGAAWYAGEPSAWARAALAVCAALLSGPISAHALARAVHRRAQVGAARAATP